MVNSGREYLKGQKSFRKKNKRTVIIFTAVAAAVILLVFWCLKITGVTLTAETLCGLNEHIHTSECFTEIPVCESEQTSELTDRENEALTETEAVIASEALSEGSETSLTREAEENETESQVLLSYETAEEHIHTNNCFEKIIICNLPEHSHSSECFPVVTADKEIAEDWESTFSSQPLTESVRENLVIIAKTQSGYKESSLNYKFSNDGTKSGYTRYGEWYGNPYGNWNAMFVSFCLNYAKAKDSDSLISSSPLTMKQKWEEHNLYASSNVYTPEKGDIAFLDTDGDNTADSVGIVLTENEESIEIILGDSNDCVETLTADKNTVIGYGVTSELEITENEDSEETVTKDGNEEISSEEETDSHNQENILLQDLLTAEEKEYEILKEQYYDGLSDEIKEKIAELPEEDKNRIKDIIFSIELLPDTEEFIVKLDEFYSNDDTEGEEEYYSETQENMIRAYALYQGYESYAEIIFNIDKLLTLKELYSRNSVQTFTTGTSKAVTFNYFNRGWSAVAPVLIYGGSANEIITTGTKPNQYWNGIVVDYDYDTNEYYVSNKYSGGTSSSADTVKSLKPSTSKGFVIFIWMADTNSTTVQKEAAAVAENVEINDRVTISVDPASLSAGYKSEGYGTVTFSEYIPVQTETEEELELYKDSYDNSDCQISDGGGKTTSADKKVITTKTINGTSEENVFDITLTVQTQTDIQTFLAEPDMAVVIVMDISNTMNVNYPTGQTATSRYDAAVNAAENFMNQFAEETSGLSKIGFVAFNTHAHEILSLQACTKSNVSSLISEMKADTKAIIKATGYADSNTRFTNVEAGLKRGYDMIKNSGNANQYIIFLSDGFPTTYLKDNSDTSTSYEGYDPNTSSGTIGADGVFHDNVTGYYCSYGTSYSDKASIKARVMANKIKTAGAKIFSIGVDVGGQTIDGYERTGLSVIDRTSRVYEIGSSSSPEAYTNWLKSSIGSNYYYDSENSAELEKAFTEIFNEIRTLNQQTTKTIWSATDPLPVYGEKAHVVEFIHFFDKNGNAVFPPANPEKIDGTHEENGENTADHNDHIIHWDLKKSGYKTTVNGSVTTYLYSLKYRVRLVNEENAFNENVIYPTNGDAYLEYRNIVSTDGVQNISELKYVSFAKPAVLGYLGPLSFTKTNDIGSPLAGAEFMLIHDDSGCNLCHGDFTAITNTEAHSENYVTQHPVHYLEYTAVSDAEGSVVFSDIPSGHNYLLIETGVPAGYLPSESSFSVNIAYDTVTVTETLNDGTSKVWTGENNIIKNIPELFILPETGGTGILPTAIPGILLMSVPVLYSIIRRKRERRLH